MACEKAIAVCGDKTSQRRKPYRKGANAVASSISDIGALPEFTRELRKVRW